MDELLKIDSDILKLNEKCYTELLLHVISFFEKKLKKHLNISTNSPERFENQSM